MVCFHMLKYTFTEEIKNLVTQLLADDVSRNEIKKTLMATYGFGKSKAYGIVSQIIDELQPVDSLSKSEVSTGTVALKTNIIEDCGTHTFNHELKQYIWQLKDGSTFVIRDFEWKAVIRDYNAGLSLAQLESKHTFSAAKLKEVFAIEHITHDTPPVTSQDLKVDVTEMTLIERKAKYKQELEKEAWKQTQTDATKWREFEFGTFDPFVEFLTNWQPPKHEPIKGHFTSARELIHGKPANRIFVVGAFDWHIGAREEARYLWKGEEWNMGKAKAAINTYTVKIANRVANDIKGFSKCVLLLGGDLYNSLTGFTSNGTPLNNEYSKDTQADGIMNALVFFIQRLLEIFPKLECHFVRGNHGGTTDYVVGKAIEFYFRNEPRLTFEVASCRTKAVKVGPVLLLLDHGASDQTKSLLPSNGKAKEAYIQSLFLAHPELLVGIKQKLFIQGDLHHYEQKEYNDFEFFMFGAMPCGSQYADTKNYHNRPRQNCLIIDDDGVTDVVHIYVE